MDHVDYTDLKGETRVRGYPHLPEHSLVDTTAVGGWVRKAESIMKSKNPNGGGRYSPLSPELPTSAGALPHPVSRPLTGP